MERLSEREKQEIARLSELGLPSRLIGKELGLTRERVRQLESAAMTALAAELDADLARAA